MGRKMNPEYQKKMRERKSRSKAFWRDVNAERREIAQAEDIQRMNDAIEDLIRYRDSIRKSDES